MKDSQKLHILFLVIFILFWNPFSIYLFYSNHEIYNSKLFKLFFWILPLFIMLLIILLRKTKVISNILMNIIFGISVTWIFWGFIVLINLLLGYINTSNKQTNKEELKDTSNLIFEPNTVAHYNTVEFDYKAEINSLGLRNKEVSVLKSDSIYRILCFGDSWTFGWGTDIENSWPMQLEKYLHEKRYSKIEVINCASPGQYTTTYKKYMAELVPLLKPDLVLVGVLQLDDLAQLHEYKFFSKNNNDKYNSTQKSGFISTTKYYFVSFIHASLDNYFSFFKMKFLKNEKKEEIDIKLVWSESANKVIQNFNSLQQLRFSFFSDTLQTLFKTGNLNASLLDVYINYPDRLPVFNNPANNITLLALKQMKKDIKEMKNICETNKAEMVFLNLPINDFVGHKVIRTPSDILMPFWMSNNKIDSMYQSIATINQIKYFELTDRFMNLKDKESYFFLYDGHPNAKGYKEIAIGVGDFLINNILNKD